MARRSRNQIVLELALVLGLWKPRLNLGDRPGGALLATPGSRASGSLHRKSDEDEDEFDYD